MGLLLTRTTFTDCVYEKVRPLEQKVYTILSTQEYIYELREKISGSETFFANLAGYCLIVSGGYGIGKRKS